MQMPGDIQDVSDQSSQEEAFVYEEDDDLGEDGFYDEFDETQSDDDIMNEDENNDLAISPITISAQKHKRKFDEMQGGNIMNEDGDNDLTISPIKMFVQKRKRTNANTNVVTSEEVNNNNHSTSNENIHNNGEELNNTPHTETQPINTNTVIQRQTPVVARVANVDKNIAKKRKSNNKWQIILFIIASIVIIGALVLAILAALGVFKKKDDIPPAGNDTGNNADNTTNIKDNNVNINDNNNIINNNDDPINNNNNQSVPTIETSDNIDGKYDAGILGDDSYHGSTTISNHDWDGISKSGDLFNDGDITYTDRFKEIVSCENSPDVTYTLWEDLNNDGICQINEILAKGKGFMVDGNCAIIDGRKFALTDNMQAYSNLNKLSNQELKVLNHTSTYWKDGRPHILLDGLKASVNIDTEHIGASINTEGFKIGDVYTNNIEKNGLAKNIIESYLNNNNLTEDQKKLISAWATGHSSDNVKQLINYLEMDNTQSSKNLKDTYPGPGQNM